MTKECKERKVNRMLSRKRQKRCGLVLAFLSKSLSRATCFNHIHAPHDAYYWFKDDLTPEYTAYLQISSASLGTGVMVNMDTARTSFRTE